MYVMECELVVKHNLKSNWTYSAKPELKAGI